jgi:hypothetical protein
MRRISLGVAGLGLAFFVGSACNVLIGLDQFHDGTASTGGGAPIAKCKPGEKTSVGCPYDGLQGTEGVGVCKRGQRECDVDGTWGACSPAVTPQEKDDCSTPLDENCDGTVNEASAGCCKPGAALTCYTGPAGTEGVAACKAGSQVCGESGLPPKDCTGETLPALELCAAPADENCDGHDCIEWVVLQGDSETQAFAGLASVGDGSVIVSGVLSGTAGFDDHPVSGAGSGDVLVAKLGTDGKALWARSFGDAGIQFGGAVVVDNKGNVVFAGCSTTALDLGGKTATT